ncbi:MAG TPA: hypothetical protein VJ476_04660 [Rhizomicrobium sp.]|nr:hypothetical protein [Rhizomicrobium sp.]
MSGRKLRNGLIVSGLAAVLTPAAFAGILIGASVIAGGPDVAAFAAQGPKPPPPPHRTTLSSLGRASAVAWISGGHAGH